MKLDEKKLLDVINEKWKTKNCLLCASNNWSINSDIMTLVGVGSDKALQLGGKFIPLIAITCNECGNTILVNPLAIKCIDNI